MIKVRWFFIFKRNVWDLKKEPYTLERAIFEPEGCNRNNLSVNNC